jgi:hypothetical protein
VTLPAVMKLLDHNDPGMTIRYVDWPPPICSARSIGPRATAASGSDAEGTHDYTTRRHGWRR